MKAGILTGTLPDMMMVIQTQNGSRDDLLPFLYHSLV